MPLSPTALPSRCELLCTRTRRSRSDRQVHPLHRNKGESSSAPFPPVLTPCSQLNDRILNNDLLRYLAKTQTDTEPGIRTNTCILLGRLSRLLQPATNRKVLVPAFARALRDPFVHARIAGLMALMATADCYEKEDLAGKVIPAMSICLVDRER